MHCGCGWAGELGKCRQGHGGQGHGEQGHGGQEPGGQGRCRWGVGGQGRCMQAAGGGDGHQSAPGGWSRPRKTKDCLGTWRSGTGPASKTIKLELKVQILSSTKEGYVSDEVGFAIVDKWRMRMLDLAGGGEVVDIAPTSSGRVD